MAQTTIRKNTDRPHSRPNVLNLFFDSSTGVYASSNAEYLPNVTRPIDGLSSIFDGLKTRWAYDDYFYCAMVPVQVNYDLPMLDCLSPTAMNVRKTVDARGEVYRMDDRLCREWIDLERAVIELQRRLLLRIPGTYLLTVAPPYPSSFGYAQDWPSESKATLMTRLARTAFTLRLALISYLVMKETIKGRPTWQDLTETGERPIPLAFCNTIRASWVCDWAVPRVGAFVDIGGKLNPDGGRQWHQDINDMINVGIPLWFGYGHQAHRDRDLSAVSQLEFNRYLPSQELFNTLKSITRKVYERDNNEYVNAQLAEHVENVMVIDESEHYGYMEQYNTQKAPSTQILVRSRNGPTTRYELSYQPTGLFRRYVDDLGETHQQIYSKLLFHGYRQRAGDTYLSFIERERYAGFHLTKTETPAARERRLRREAENREQPIPRIRGPKVFLWTGVRDSQVRRQVRTGRIPALWARTSSAQRTYNSFRNEYDVDESKPEWTDADNDIDEITPDDRVVSPESRRRSLSPIRRSPLSNSRSRSPFPNHRRRTYLLDDEINERNETVDLTDITGNLLKDPDDTNTDTVNVIVEPIRQILIQRYGYLEPTTNWIAEEAEAKKWLATNDMKSVHSALAHWDRNDSLTSERDPPTIINSIADLVATLKRGGTPPAMLCDLNRQSTLRQPIVSQIQEELHAHSRGGTRTDTWWWLQSMDANALTIDTNCRILTNCATNILHITRAKLGWSADEILLNMISRGMTVRLLRPIKEGTYDSGTTAGKSFIGDRPIGIGVKPHGIRLTKLDYRQYVRVRSELLNKAAGPAALLRGGILWRLTIDSCNLEDALRGPDIDETTKDETRQYIKYGGSHYVENALSEQDGFIISGVYRVLLPGDSQKHGASITSWWPTEDVWRESGYYTGYWSHAAEEWYQRRLKQLEEGTAEAATSSHWRNILRYTKTSSRTFLSRVDTLSAEALNVTP